MLLCRLDGCSMHLFAAFLTNCFIFFHQVAFFAHFELGNRPLIEII